MKELLGLRVCMVVLSILFNTNNLLAQSNNGLSSFSDQTKLIMSPPPTASELGKYAEVPVGLYTGIPGISVPLYQISENGYKLDISLSYHASGIKVQQRASWVGLGWSLNAGGVITRAVRGLPDDQDTLLYYYYVNDINGIHSAIPNPVGKIRSNSWHFPEYADIESDEYFYNFNGHTGSFYFDKNNNLKLSDASNLKIEMGGFDWRGIQYFIITTDDGIKYTFSNREVSCPMPMKSQYDNFPRFDRNSDIFWWLKTNAFISSWYLTKIDCPDNDTDIVFTYNTSKYNYLERAGEMHYYSTYLPLDDAPCSLILNWCDFYNEWIFNSFSYQWIEGSVLTTIEWSGGKVVFTPSPSIRKDVLTYNDPYFIASNPYPSFEGKENYLGSIAIYDKSNNPIKHFDLGYTYFQSPGYNSNPEFKEYNYISDKEAPVNSYPCGDRHLAFFKNRA